MGHSAGSTNSEKNKGDGFDNLYDAGLQAADLFASLISARNIGTIRTRVQTPFGVVTFEPGTKLEQEQKEDVTPAEEDNDELRKQVPTEERMESEADIRAAKQIENAFRYHRPPQEAQDKMRKLRGKFRELGHLIRIAAPEGRERSSALTRLEESQMHTNAAISRQYPITDD